jgi:hypothetical protein
MNIATPTLRDPIARIYDTFHDAALSGVLICNAETLALTGQTPAKARALLVARKALRLAEHAADQADNTTLAQALRALIAAQDAVHEIVHHRDGDTAKLGRDAAKDLRDAAQAVIDDWGLEG